jgi:hypothetical protein
MMVHEVTRQCGGVNVCQNRRTSKSMKVISHCCVLHTEVIIFIYELTEKWKIKHIIARNQQQQNENRLQLYLKK